MELLKECQPCQMMTILSKPILPLMMAAKFLVFIVTLLTKLLIFKAIIELRNMGIE